VILSGFKRLKGSSNVEITIKKMLITFFDIKGNVHFQFIPEGQQSQSREDFSTEMPERLPSDWILQQ
jgi:hypothetical protein